MDGSCRKGSRTGVPIVGPLLLQEILEAGDIRELGPAFDGVVAAKVQVRVSAGGGVRRPAVPKAVSELCANIHSAILAPNLWSRQANRQNLKIGF